MKPYKMLLILALQNSCDAFFNRPVAKHTYVPPLSSHFSVISTTITDKAILKKSLLDLNNQYTIYNGPTTIVGYNKQEIEVDEKKGYFFKLFASLATTIKQCFFSIN